MKKIMEKLKEVLSEEDLENLQLAIDSLVEEQVGEKLEKEKEVLKVTFEEQLAEEVAKKEIEIKEKLDENYQAELEAFEEDVVDKLDKFLDKEICENINESAFEKVAINEAYGPVVSGILNVLKENYVEFDSDGQKIVKEAQAKVEELEEKFSDSVADRISLQEKVEELSKKLLIAEKSNELSESQKEKLEALCEGKDFDKLQEKIDIYVGIVTKESDEKKVEDKDEKIVSEAVVSDKDGIKETVLKQEKEENPLIKNASRFA